MRWAWIDARQGIYNSNKLLSDRTSFFPMHCQIQDAKAGAWFGGLVDHCKMQCIRLGLAAINTTGSCNRGDVSVQIQLSCQWRWTGWTGGEPFLLGRNLTGHFLLFCGISIIMGWTCSLNCNHNS